MACWLVMQGVEVGVVSGGLVRLNKIGLEYQLIEGWCGGVLAGGIMRGRVGEGPLTIPSSSSSIVPSVYRYVLCALLLLLPLLHFRINTHIPNTPGRASR